MANEHSRTIPISGGLTLIVDADDYALAASRRWQAHPGKLTHYASTIDRSTGRQVRIYLHRIIAGAKRGQRVDHINGNGLDNRRANLRICTNVENMRNMKRGRGASAFKGVAWFKRDHKWRAYIVVAGKQLHLGYFHEEREAAVAYDTAARLHFGAFANLNFPESER